MTEITYLPSRSTSTRHTENSRTKPLLKKNKKKFSFVSNLAERAAEHEVGVGGGGGGGGAARRRQQQERVVGGDWLEVGGEAEVVDDGQRLQVVEELLALVLLAQEGVPLVEGAQELGLVEQRAQVLGQQLLLEWEADEGARHADFGLDFGELVDAAANGKGSWNQRYASSAFFQKVIVKSLVFLWKDLCLFLNVLLIKSS